jgi:hypothetical protein
MRLVLIALRDKSLYVYSGKFNEMVLPGVNVLFSRNGVIASEFLSS